MSRNEYSNMKSMKSKKVFIHYIYLILHIQAKLYKEKEYPEAFSLINSTAKKSPIKSSNKPLGIKRMTSTQIMNPIIVTHSISPHHHKKQKSHHHNSSVPVFKYYNCTKKLKMHQPTLGKYNKIVKSTNTSITVNPTNKNTINHSNSTLTPNSNIKSNNTNNYIINTLNVSAKNLIGNSVDYSDPPDYEVKMKKLQKENEELRFKIKDKEETVEAFKAKNKQLEKRLYDTIGRNKKIKKMYNDTKESENQLLAMLYVIDQSGVCVDDIINQFNKENQTISTKRTIDSNMYTPITLEYSVQPKPLENIPKLNLKNIINYNNNDALNIDNSLLFLNEEDDNIT